MEPFNLTSIEFSMTTLWCLSSENKHTHSIVVGSLHNYISSCHVSRFERDLAGLEEET
jgi:hypothetical protein